MPDSQSRESMSMVRATDDSVAPAEQPVRSHRTWRRPSAEYLRECGLSEELLQHTDLLPDELLLILCWHERARAWVLKNEGPITAALKTPAGTRDADRWDREEPILVKSAQPLEKVKVRGGYASGPSSSPSCRDLRQKSGSL